MCLRHKPEVTAVAMIALAAKFNNHDLQASASVPGKTWFQSFTKGVPESVIEGTVVIFLSLEMVKTAAKPQKVLKIVRLFKF